MSQPIKAGAWEDESGIHSKATESQVELHSDDIQALIALTQAGTPSEINAALSNAHKLLGNRVEPLRELLTQMAIRAQALYRTSQLATIDELSGVANRRAFNDAAARALSRAERTRGSVALLMLDLDDLKTINDRSGHPAGDRAIITLAQCCLSMVRTTDTVARLGGDEFAVLLPDADAACANTIAKRIEQAVSQEVVAGQTLSVSVGASITDPYVRTVDDLVASADAALYRSKRSKLGPAR